MSLTGLPLQLLAVALLIVWVAALALWWSRLRRWWRLARAAGIVLCQLLLVFTVGLAVNRTEDFYPSWAALLGTDPPKISTVPPPAVPLATWLHRQQARGARSGLSFQWRADRDKQWYLRAPTAVLLPRAYFGPNSPVLPAVVILVGPEHTGSALSWAPARIEALSASSPAVMVVVQPGAKGPSSGFGPQLVALLGADLHVTPDGWGIVGVGSAAAAAVRLFHADPARYGCLALPTASPAPAARVRAMAQGRPLMAAAHDGVPVTLRWIFDELPPTLLPPLVVASASPANQS
jgi:hypothetical protein